MTKVQQKKRILIAPLNWGLGHATRCIPIINALVHNNYEPIIASDGMALQLLQKEFPQITSLELPSYNIKYPKNGKQFKLKLTQQLPKLIAAIKAEKKTIEAIVSSYHIDGIISDNRLGAYHEHLPCVFLTHQLQVLSGNTTWLSTKLHQKAMANFTECWVPDYPDNQLSGTLSQANVEHSVKFMGPISRFKKEKRPIIYDVLVLLSGPEPQRTLLENKLLQDFKTYNGKVAFVSGRIENEQHISEVKQMTTFNFMTTTQLQTTINESALVVSRSGYTTIMDLAKTGKKAFFIPTPGQFEQKYLAQYLHEKGLVPYCKQEDFNIERLSKVKHYKGLNFKGNNTNWNSLFGLF